TPGATPPAPIWDATARLAELRGPTPPTDAAAAWALREKVEREADVWTVRNAPAGAVAALKDASAKLTEEALRFDPEFAAARDLRGEVRYRDELAPFLEASWLDARERDKARTAHLWAMNKAWLTRAEYDQRVKATLAAHGATLKEREAMMASPYGVAATKLIEETVADLAKHFPDGPKFIPEIAKPYVIFVEENASWDARLQARQCVDPLLELEATFFDLYQKFGLVRLDRPVPVLFFRDRERYEDFSRKSGNPVGPGVIAYFDWTTGRLVLNDGPHGDYTTRLHEGAHQLMFAYTKRDKPLELKEFLKQSYWFHEGIAEWFGGSTRVNVDGKWKYEVGNLQVDRITETIGGIDRGRRFRLPALLGLTYGDRPRLNIGQTVLTYAQGWLVCYFCNHFNVDERGMVVLGKPGKYAAGFEKYLHAELHGKTGKKTFMECLELDDAKLDAMADEFDLYTEWVLHKIKLRQFKDKKLIPWNEVTSKRGEKTGEEQDDLLDRSKVKKGE
ncbi:MAG TPA: hypothetical protein VEI02_05455, partial [Planctomycetota bacterium]|nr:hypothetical protein [Planctomycetota bacterium]